MAMTRTSRGSCHTDIKYVCEVPNDVRYRNFMFRLGPYRKPVITVGMRATVALVYYLTSIHQMDLTLSMLRTSNPV